MNTSDLFEYNKPIPKKHLIPGVWYTTNSGIHICFKNITERGRIAGSAYILDDHSAYDHYGKKTYMKYGETASQAIKMTSPDILAQYGLSQSCLMFPNKEITKINEFTDFYNKLKFKI